MKARGICDRSGRGSVRMSLLGVGGTVVVDEEVGEEETEGARFDALSFSVSHHSARRFCLACRTTCVVSKGKKAKREMIE